MKSKTTCLKGKVREGLYAKSLKYNVVAITRGLSGKSPTIVNITRMVGATLM